MAAGGTGATGGERGNRSASGKFGDRGAEGGDLSIGGEFWGGWGRKEILEDRGRWLTGSEGAATAASGSGGGGG